MLQQLSPQFLAFLPDGKSFDYQDTSALLATPVPKWIGQRQAEAAANFGLSIRQAGFHLIVVGESGSGRTSLMLQSMQALARQHDTPPDVIVMNDFSFPEKPLVLKAKSGHGHAIRHAFEHYLKQLAKGLPPLVGDASEEKSVQAGFAFTDKPKTIADFIAARLAELKEATLPYVLDVALMESHFGRMQQDILNSIEIFQIQAGQEGESDIPAFLGRHRINVFVDNRGLTGAPVIYDDDPSFASLFGGLESGSDATDGATDFLRLRAGNLLKANGGMLMLHLRDIENDQQAGSQILEKLQRFLRNGRVQIEEVSAGSSQSAFSHFIPSSLESSVKVVLVATHEEYYAFQEKSPELAAYFNINVMFEEAVAASDQRYSDYACYVAAQCARYGLPHFTVDAVRYLLKEAHRIIEDRTRLSTRFDRILKLMFESVAMVHNPEALVDKAAVKAALDARLKRGDYPERMIRESIHDGELLVTTTGQTVGQINGLSFIEMGDTGFGSPVRISARCHAGVAGVINIDREVAMTGPTHDKGLLILKSWLASNFKSLAPLSLDASLVFEQEYYGVEGDSASCAELFALLSELSGMPLSNGIAVTGALNQHGDVLPIGGVNEKIEGYFRVCRDAGLNGMQGVMIPARNLQHLILSDEVIEAVNQGLFHVYAIDHVLDGIQKLTDTPAGDMNAAGYYPEGSVMAKVQATLEGYRETCKRNQPFNR